LQEHILLSQRLDTQNLDKQKAIKHRKKGKYGKGQKEEEEVDETPKIIITPKEVNRRNIFMSIVNRHKP